MSTADPSPDGWFVRHYRALAGLVLLLAAFNLTFRLSAENVEAWDESLYATSAVEMLDHRHWAATTLEGQLDYYNSKPPLNVWLLVLSFQALGVNLFALRIVSALSAWLTILLLMVWARRVYGPAVALLSGVVLATTFGFLHVHSGRSGNPDALLTLVLFAIMLVEWRAERTRSAVLWLGPLLAAVFMLKGVAVLMPLVFVTGLAGWRAMRQRPVPWRHAAIATVLFLAPVASWATMRWQVDEWQFIGLLFTQDLAIGFDATDGHAGPWFYYLNVLQRHQYDWLAAALVAALLMWPLGRSALTRASKAWRSRDPRSAVVCWWAVVAFGVPTLMQTKLQWYLNPFYPVFALSVAWVVVRATQSATLTVQRRRIILAVALTAFVTAEAKLVWHSLHRRNLDGTVQQLVMGAGQILRGRQVFRQHWELAEVFVVRGIAGARYAVARNVEDFLEASPVDSYFVAQPALVHESLELIEAVGDHALYRHR